MKKLVSVLIITAIAVLSCKKDRGGPYYQAQANFAVSALFLGNNYQDALVKVGTYDQLLFANQSEHADSVQWDFGNGEISNSYDATYDYENAGTYTVTLTVYNHNGTHSSYSRKIQAMERVIKKLTLSNLYLNRFEPFYQATHTFAKADLWVEVKYDQKGEPNVTLPGGGLNIPILYQSPVFSNVDSSFHGTLTYELPQSTKAVINYPVRNSTYPFFPANTRGTVVELWAKDNTGTYLMGSSWGTGLHLLTGGGNPATSNTFDLGYSVPDRILANEIKLDCVYQ
jgi:PKD repeat protein